MKNDSFEIAMLIKEIYADTVGIVSCNLKDCGLTHQQITVIKIVAHEKKVTVSDLCDRMSLSKGTVSGIVTRLEEAGYVEKLRSEKDKRITYITFTNKGKTFAKEYKDTMNNSFNKIVENLTEDEIKELKENLLKIKKIFKENK